MAVLEDILNPVKVELETLERRLIDEISVESRSLCSILQTIFQAGGKRLRPMLSFLTFKALETSYKITTEKATEKMYLVAEISELIHTASLVHDDIIDNSLVRRGMPTANSKWSNAITVISGDFMFARAAVNLGKLGFNSITSIYANVLENLCLGEIQQVEKKFSTEKDYDYYFSKSYKKTASLFEASTLSITEFFEISDQEKQAIAEYGRNLGIAFQIFDDILDFTATEAELGKPAGSDIKEGQINIPVLYALEELESQDPELAKNLAEKITNLNSDQQDKASAVNEILEIIKSTNAINKSLETANDYIKKSIDSISFLTDSDYKLAMQNLASFVANRNS